jgi:hypothetical protein
MSDAAHGLPGQTSDFEYRLLERRDDSPEFPVSGRYGGWFFLKHFAPKPGQVKVDEKEIHLTFKPNTDGNGDSSKAFTVTGEGQNKFGKFSVHGTMSVDGHLHLYKVYTKKPLQPAHSTTPKTPRSAFPAATGPAIVPATPRESSGRVRKPSVAMLDVLETSALAAAAASAKHPAASKGKQAAAAAATTQAAATAGAGRAPRAAVPMQKCGDLLREIMKHIQAAYFKEPVDYVKLCIPDYPDIIKEPMDFSTIQQNLDKSVYSTPEAFADHMRLVFKNAVTYNQRRDHPVHIAARELSSKFEERYRALMAQLNPMADYETNFKAVAAVSSGKKSTGPKARHSTGGGAGMSAAGLMRPGPREAVIPPALDAGMQTLIEMQRAMKGMQDELLQLRTQLRQSEIKSSVEVQRQAAQDPMTLEEKQALVDRINRLDEERMREIIEIVQEALPATANADSDDIDIPIDDLDTFTLRKMQAVVQRGDKEQVKRKRVTQPTGAKPGPKGKRSKTATPAPVAAPSASIPSASPMQVPPQRASSSTFFGASAEDAALTADEPLSMDTALPLSQEDYSDLILEVSEHVDATTVVQNASAWSADSLRQHAAPVLTEHAGSNNNLRWSEDARASAAIRKLEEVAYRPVPMSVAAPGAIPSETHDETSALQRRREEERRAFQDMERSVNLDQHRDSFYGEP